MSRSDLERLSKEELIELVLRLHRPEKTSRTSSKPPASDRKERREKARPGGAKPGHDGHKRALTPDPDQVVEHRPASCPACGEVLAGDLPAEVISVHERIDLPPRSSGGRAAPAPGRDLPGLPDPGRRPATGGI